VPGKYRISYCMFLCCFTMSASAQYKASPHREPQAGEIPVSKPGSYGEAGRTYILTNDISSDKSTVFLGKDVTLDLNGYTIKYADGNYNHVSNPGFEAGLKDWDISKAPGAKIMNTADIHVFVGDKLMSLQPGDEITSSYVYLPVANRSYIAMCGVTGRHYHDSAMKGDVKNEMKVSVFVEDEQGKELRCLTKYRDTTMISCPVEKRSPRLGGGYVYAHLNHLPAGKYRVRIRADTDCLVDEIDIRPAMDVGIGIVDETYAMGHYDHLYESKLSAFFDYTADAASGTALASIPVVKGRGSVTIRNGVIENRALGVMSWGIQSTADQVKLVLDNVSIKTAGINTTAIDVPQATITHCRFEVKSPFIINRHGSNFYAVDLRGNSASEVSYSEFYGGQGCLVFKGMHSDIHHNYFVNNQSVTNHYSIMAMGDSSRIFDNRIEPERGSGIEIFRHKYIDIFNNTIKVQSSAPTCEYGTEEYSANAIRIADYRAMPGAIDGASGNRVYNNKIFIRAINFDYPEEYVPLSWAFFYSASGGDNDIFGNDIVIEHTDPGSKALASGFFITGGTEGFGGNFYNNRITTNVPAAWVAGKYGGTINTKIYNNTIIKTPNAPANFKPFRMGFDDCGDCLAKNVEFRSNTIVNDTFAIDASKQEHSYSVYWKLTVNVTDKKGKPVPGAEVTISGNTNGEVIRKKSGEDGRVEVDLCAYTVDGEKKIIHTPYTVQTGKEKKQVLLNKDTELSFWVKHP
ncbi:MAG TPA: hypothetical protein VFV68_05305, partial [Agriterribacter sp.]|nr:hypothetical protein [Agriterribacter sp.]